MHFIAFQLCFRTYCQEGKKNLERLELDGIRQFLVCADVNMLSDNINAIRKK